MNTRAESNFWGSGRCYFVASCLAIVTFFWGIGIVDGNDATWHDNAWLELLKRISGIDPSINGGVDRSNNYTTLVWMALEALVTAPFSHSGILAPVTSIITQRFFFGVVLFINTLVFFRTCERLSGEKLNLFAAGVVGVYFSYSYYFYFCWTGMQLNILSIPLFFATLTLAQAIHCGRYKREFLLWFLPSAFISATIGLQPALMAMWIFEVCILAVFYVATWRAKIRFVAMVFSGFGMVNIYWIVPYVAFVSSNNLASGSVSKEIFQSMASFDNNIGFTSYSNVLSGAAEMMFYGGYANKPYNLAAYNALSGYGHKKLMLMAIAITAMVYGLMRYRTQSGNIFRALCIFILIGSFIALSGYGPQGIIMRYLVSDAPFFWVFRNTWQKAGMLLLVALSLLLYYALRELFDYLKAMQPTPAPSLKPRWFLRRYYFLIFSPLIALIATAVICFRIPSGAPGAYGLIAQFFLFSLALCLLWSTFIAVASKQYLLSVLAVIIPLSSMVTLALLLGVNSSIADGMQPLPRSGPVIGQILFILAAVFYHDRQAEAGRRLFKWSMDAQAFALLMALVLYVHSDYIVGNHIPSHKDIGSYAEEVHAGNRPEIPKWIYPLSQQIDKPGCISVLLPVSNVNLTWWGWGGTADVLLSRGLLQNSTLIVEEPGRGFTVSKEQNLKQRNAALFSMLMKGKKIDVDMLKDIGICYLILRTDFNDRKDFTQIPTRVYQRKIDATKELRMVPIKGFEHERKTWRIYRVGEPRTTRNGYDSEDFIFPSHYAYYLTSPDPSIDRRFVRVETPDFVLRQGWLKAPSLLIAKPFAWFLLGLALFVVGLVGLWAFCRVRLKPASR